MLDQTSLGLWVDDDTEVRQREPVKSLARLVIHRLSDGKQTHWPEVDLIQKENQIMRG